MINNKRNGFGIEFFYDKLEYIGGFKDDYYDGLGMCHYPNYVCSHIGSWM